MQRTRCFTAGQSKVGVLGLRDDRVIVPPRVRVEIGDFVKRRQAIRN
jgi:hypothetical protein